MKRVKFSQNSDNTPELYLYIQAFFWTLLISNLLKFRLLQHPVTSPYHFVGVMKYSCALCVSLHQRH